jgi:preprotein translocase subunit SecD
MKDLKWKVILVIVLTIIAIYGIYPPKDKIKLGLDLRGGIHLIAEVKVEEALASSTDRIIEDLKNDLKAKQIPYTSILRSSSTTFTVDGLPAEQADAFKKIVEVYSEWDVTITGTHAVGTLRPAVITRKSEQAVETAIRIIRERIDTFGVAEAVVQKEGITGGRILIQIPGVEDTTRVKELIERTAKLELKLVTGGPSPTKEGLMVNGQVPQGSVILPRTIVEKDGSSHSDYMLVQEHAIISGEELESAQRSADEYGRPAVSFNLTTRAGEKFGTFTEANVNKQLAIVLDNKIQSAPSINSRITNRGIIQGQFTIEEANDLAVMLQSGALPAGLRFLQQSVVGPGLGLDSIRKGMTACLVAAALIVVFVLFYYRLSGVNAVVALALNMLFLMAIMSYFQATLTLPGIAGIVLSIGMAVDANVLIFERIKEDLRMGKTVRSAIENGFKKAFYPIFDSNITTIIAATFLFWFGTGPVKGFAVTLIAGIVASLFTAVWVSHLIFDLVLSKRKKVETLSI